MRLPDFFRLPAFSRMWRLRVCGLCKRVAMCVTFKSHFSWLNGDMVCLRAIQTSIGYSNN